MWGFKINNDFDFKIEIKNYLTEKKYDLYEKITLLIHWFQLFILIMKYRKWWPSAMA